MTQQYTSWTFEEETLLLARSTTGIPIATLANIHGRTSNAIRCRLERIALKYLQAGKSINDVLRLTGLSIKQIQKLQNGKGQTSVTSKHTMLSFAHTMSRSQLQAVPTHCRLDAIQRYVDQHVYQSVYRAATAGKTSYLYVLPKPTNMGKSCPPSYEPTPSDIVEGLAAKFPDCKIAYSEEWVDVRPNVRELRTGILIDWS